ncbi:MULTISPECIES: CopY/TcrY family copper transport repressor [Carnobacterium]|uniref:Penicillinase repressor family protein n=2 Tax=Carnobacterium maltaromaticum TaxID=2751 RepID=K8E587_CARML|nr:CopY/TcrY family copper transport repressor [Carnobacterium maltaromaticum]MBC9809924.1 CopY/TcrY family copper transport repressor [Carnobacterium maltaromaticum]CCO11764.2 conserved hypothetical protein [Carnobacterium maltaromaticum LMA28]
MENHCDLQITVAEWEVMRVVWSLRTVSSKQVSLILTNKMNWKPATTKTLIGRLVRKGILSTKTDGKRFIYAATISEEECIKFQVNKLLSTICNKSIGTALANAITEYELSSDDIVLIKNKLEKKIQSKIACECVPEECECRNH